MRTIFRSLEFETFYNSLPDKVKDKIKYALNVISEIKKDYKKEINKARQILDTLCYENEN